MLRVSASFFITARDQHGAVCGGADDMPFALCFRGPEQPVHRVSLLPDGRFQVQWCTTTSGSFTIEVLVRGENVPGSPFSCVAEHGRIESRGSLVTGAELLRRVAVGHTLRFGILARDQARSGSSPSAALLHHAPSAALPSPHPLSAALPPPRSFISRVLLAALPQPLAAPSAAGGPRRQLLAPRCVGVCLLLRGYAAD